MKRLVLVVLAIVVAVFWLVPAILGALSQIGLTLGLSLGALMIVAIYARAFVMGAREGDDDLDLAAIMSSRRRR